MKEDKIAEQLEYMVNSRGWVHFSNWINTQIENMTNRLLSVDLDKIEDIKEIRTKIQTYREILAKPKEIIENK